MNIIEWIVNWIWLKRNAPYGPACGFEEHISTENDENTCLFCNRKFKKKSCGECGIDYCEYLKEGAGNCCPHGDMPDAVNKYCSPCRHEHYADLADAARKEE